MPPLTRRSLQSTALEPLRVGDNLLIVGNAGSAASLKHGLGGDDVHERTALQS